MSTITIRRLEESVKTRLRVRAAEHGRSMEEEARAILKSGLDSAEPAEQNLAASIHERFARLGGVRLAPLRREPMRRPARFGK